MLLTTKPLYFLVMRSFSFMYPMESYPVSCTSEADVFSGVPLILLPCSLTMMIVQVCDLEPGESFTLLAMQTFITTILNKWNCTDLSQNITKMILNHKKTSLHLV
jgi:hypothetical protein